MATATSRVISLLCLLFILISYTTAQQSFLYQFCMNDKGNYTANSAYKTNLNTLLSTLTSNTEIDYGFYNFTYGQNSDKVNAIGMCRGDVKPDACRSCLNNSTVLLTQRCPNQKEAIGWYDKCMLRYSNRSIFGIMETSPSVYVWNPNNATEANQFNPVLLDLLRNLTREAASGDSRRKYAVADTTDPNYQIINALVQCTPDLSHQDCYDCLVGGVSEIPKCCIDKTGGRVIRPSCMIRYASVRSPLFYGPTPTLDPQVPQSTPPVSPLPSPSPNNPSSQGKNKSSLIAVAISVPVVVVLVFSFICIYLKARKPRKISETEDDNEIESSESLQFNLSTIRVATNDFSDSNKLGQGGFGAVYRGRLSNGQEIAVKRLSTDSRQGDIEFKNEVLLVAKLQHRNLVRLLGFCLEGIEKLLVYEFVPNKSLDYFIFDAFMKAQLDWESRYKIIGGIARGILYLHEDSRLRVIHRDIKASNILLDEEMSPKISDFGMARLFGGDQIHGKTNRIVGTYGYMAPEYAMHGKFSVKSDVFSFGVLVLEILSGKKNEGVAHGENLEDLMSFSWRNWREGTALNIVDPALDNGSQSEIIRCIHIGLLCVQENVAARPTMAAVVWMLNCYSVALPIPSKPAFYVENGTGNLPDKHPWEYNLTATKSTQQLIRSSQESVNEISVTDLYPR